jgi:hypothetical protein
VDGPALFTVGDRHDVMLKAMQSVGMENSSSVEFLPAPPATQSSLRIEANVDLVFDAEGLPVPEARAQLVVFRSFAGQYGPERLTVLVHLRSHASLDAESDALRDLDDAYTGVSIFDHAAGERSDSTRLFTEVPSQA